MNTETKDTHGVAQREGCNVSSTFNFTIGGIAVAIALVVGYLAYVYIGGPGGG